MNCKLLYKKVTASVKLEKLAIYFSSLQNPSILGGNNLDSASNRYSYFAAEPVDKFESFGSEDIFEKLRSILNKYKLDTAANKHEYTQNTENVFTGGWIGFFSYDLNKYIENITPANNDDLNLPLIRLCFYDKVICYDRIENCFYLFALEMENGLSGSEKIAGLENILKKANQIQEQIHFSTDCDFDISQFKSNMTKNYYLDAIGKVKEKIRLGDVYQINFSQRFAADFSSKAADLFSWQNKFNPSPYSAFIDAGDYKIVSASPELFINIKNGTIKTCPIKGTRPRTYERITDEKNIAELIASKKEQAELDMIIDLERNDLGRICQPGTIKVTDRRKIEAFSTVFHAVSTIRGKIKENLDFTDCLKAVFPGGSISGAPKISAMNTINSLEPTARGLYTGSIGWIDLNSNACLNIVIRTIIIKAGIAFAQTGGGIVADSDPQAEWAETIVKAKALLNGIKNVNKPLKH